MIIPLEKNSITESIVDQWNENNEIYEQLGKRIKRVLDEEIFNLGLFPNVSFRVKDLASLIKKVLRNPKQYPDPFNDVTDKLGIRIICKYESDLSKVKPLIPKFFSIRKYEDKRKKIKPDQLAYSSIHYDVNQKDSKHFGKVLYLEDLIIEIQIRTVCQHAWADLAHDLVYKPGIKLRSNLERSVYRLVSLLELCDDQFNLVKKRIMASKSSKIYMVLSELEKAFFKIAKRDYNKDISIETIRNLLESKLKNATEVDEFIRSLRNFLNTNHSKLEDIFRVREWETYTNVYFSQPELFLIWYLLDNDEYYLRSEWSKYYDIAELEDIAIWWGRPIAYAG